MLVGCNKQQGLVGERVYKEVQINSWQNDKERYNNLKLEAEESKRKREEEFRRLEEERKRKEIEEQKKINKFGYVPTSIQEVDFTLTFYTALPEENGGWTITAWGEELQYGMVASNYYSKDTKILLEGYGNFRVADRGGSNFNVYNRLDVLIPRNKGESDSEYLRRVNNMGVVKVKGYIHR